MEYYIYYEVLRDFVFLLILIGLAYKIKDVKNYIVQTDITRFNNILKQGIADVNKENQKETDELGDLRPLEK